MVVLTLLSIGNFDYGINSRDAKNANYGKKANNAKKAKNWYDLKSYWNSKSCKKSKEPNSLTLALKKSSRAMG